jgi:hypothetical protein
MRFTNAFIGLLSVALVIAQSGSALAAAADSTSAGRSKPKWDFTPQDYTQLKAKGGELRYSERSLWMPEKLLESLMTALKYVLDESLTPSSTAGINRVDFYHGHLICNSSNSRLQELMQGLEKDRNQAFEAAGLKWYVDPTEANFKTWAPIIDKLDRKAGAAVGELINEGMCIDNVIQFHTFEYNNTAHGVAVNDMRRHLSTKLGDDKILRAVPPPEPDPLDFKIELFTDDSKPRTYSTMFNFGFLIDREGVIYVTEGSLLGLHRFTGVKD